MAGGAPKGNQNAAKSAQMSAKLRARLEERAKMSEIVDQLIDKACEGDLAAIKEVFDRLDGKPKQSIDMDTTVKQFVVSSEPEMSDEEWLKKHT